MLLVDAHLDLAWNALQWNRDLRLPVHTIRTLESRTPGPGRGLGTVALPDMRRGWVALSFATLLARSTGCPEPYLDYSSTAQAFGVAQGQLAYYRALEVQGEARIIEGLEVLEAHWEAWTTWAEADAIPGMEPPLGFVIAMEGADPILEPDDLLDWYTAGLRVLSLSHYGPGRYAGGTGTELGLTELGRALLTRMEELGILLDLTHLSDVAFWEALDHYQGPVLASHNNVRALVPHQRQFTDAQIQAIIERDGVIGVVCDAWMLKPGWVSGQSSNHDVTLDQVVDHIDYICQLAGNSRHVGIGSDLDGGFGRDQSPRDLDTIADLQRIPEILRDRGYEDGDIAAIAHGNWLRLLYQAWGE